MNGLCVLYDVLLVMDLIAFIALFFAFWPEFRTNEVNLLPEF